MFVITMNSRAVAIRSNAYLRIATDSFTNLLGSGGFGAVYKGVFNNETIVAVKILHGSSDKRIEEQFMAELCNRENTHVTITGGEGTLTSNLQKAEWLPRWVWENVENGGDLAELIKVCEIEDNNRGATERMVKPALWCVLYRTELRPMMSMVVKMLEGAVEIPVPSNPFAHLLVETHIPSISALTTTTETPADSNLLRLQWNQI
ncbi:hypothetical protein PTKIN_Ptkin11bG0126000 [Pterospermum kingtungense]